MGGTGLVAQRTLPQRRRDKRIAPLETFCHEQEAQQGECTVFPWFVSGEEIADGAWWVKGCGEGGIEFDASLS